MSARVPGPTPEQPRTAVPKRGQRARPSPGSPAGRRRPQVAQQRKRRNLRLTIAAIVVVVVVVAVFVVVNLTSDATAERLATGSSTSGPVPASVTAGLAAVHPTTLAAAAADTTAPGLAKPTAIDGAALTTAGKPTVLYMGAEYCPYCATERWALVLALSQFGHFTGLTHIVSDDLEAAPVPNLVPTFSFYRSTYTSPYLTFTPVEMETRDPDVRLQTPTAAEVRLLDRYGYEHSIPFVYIDGKAVVTEAEYDPDLLKETGDFAQIARSILGGTSALASSVDAAAGYLTSDICAATGGKPGDVCKAFPTAITAR